MKSQKANINDFCKKQTRTGMRKASIEQLACTVLFWAPWLSDIFERFNDLFWQHSDGCAFRVVCLALLSDICERFNVLFCSASDGCAFRVVFWASWYLRFNVLFCSASATDGYEFHEMVDVESCCLQISRSKWFRMGSDKQFGCSGLDFVISETGGSM